MSQMTKFASTGGLLLALCAAFSGCSSRTDVSTTGSTPAQFTHVFITAQAVWFNANANADPDDSGWAKFPLKTPVTVDLVTESNGTLGELANDLRLAPGTYNSILLLPVDPALALTANAQAAGAVSNEEADFVDTAGTTHQVALILPNQEKGIVVPGASLKVPVGGGGLPSTGTTSTTGTTTGTTTTGTTTGTTTSGTTSSTSSNTVTVSFATNFDGNRDLHLFSYGGTSTSGTTTTNTLTGALLSASPSASDLSTTGGISGTLTLTATSTILTANTSVSDRIAIQACAESVTTDTTHHVVVACAPVQTDGTFTIYPLPSNSKTPTVYDVVIHGPNIATIIVKAVAVTTTTPTLTAAASTAGSVGTTTASGAVSLGTFTPRQTNAFLVNVTPSTTAPLPAGAAVTFYQTLPTGEPPYVIDEVGIDPVNLNLQTNEALSVGTVDSGTYASSGATITLTTSTPVESSTSAAGYKVAATAPLYADGASTTFNTVSATAASTVAGPTSTAPISSTATAAVTLVPVTVTVPALTPANSSAVASITATITPTTAGQYTGGELLVSRSGALIGGAPLSSTVLSSGGPVTVSGLPSGSVGNYYLSVIEWNSAQNTFNYESIASPVSLSGGNATVAVPID